jgi:hypothetical protein
MHLIQDENGNPVAHGHEHAHTHTHSYEHSHPHSHEHGHEDEHTHSHEQGCEQDCSSCGSHHHHEQEIPSGDKMTALLDYMLKHNEHHAAELDQVAEKLRQEGKEQAAEQIKKAVDEFQKGNMYLSLALSLVK